jgi:predicted amidohydrolase YtcJ
LTKSIIDCSKKASVIIHDFCKFGNYQKKILMKKITLIIPILLIIVSCSHFKKEADLIIHNAKIYTVNNNFAMAEALAVKDGKFIAVGENKEIINNYESENKINLNGKPVYPGFIDPHCHFFGYSMNLRQVNLVGTDSFDSIIEKLKQYNKKNNPEWLVGRGWDQNDWKVKKFPDKDKLDREFPDKPVFLKRIDGHAAIVNSKALKIAGIDENTQIEGGKILKENGQPTGVLIDNAAGLVSKHIPEPTREEKINALQKGAENCFGVGLTTVADAGLPYQSIQLMDSLQQNGALKMQTYVMLSPTEKNFKNYVEKGKYNSGKMHIQSIKLFADGALGSRGACLLNPYSDDPDNVGFMVTDRKTMKQYAQKAYKNNYQVNTHAIGDSANRVVLNLYGELLKENNDRRWRIEHAQVIHPDDFKLFAKYSIIPAVNTTHATSDMFWADERLGEERLKHAYAYKKLLKQNGWLCNGSDFPVEDINPLYGFYAGVIRKNLQREPEEGFQTENALSRKEALKAMTIWAAKSCFEENYKGSIEKGKNADFVVTDLDIMNVEESEIPETRVLKTFLQGKQVFGQE